MSAPGTIFISYHRKDSAAIATSLHDELKKQGLSVWLDIDQIHGGAVWTDRTEEAIDGSICILALISAGSNQSQICRAEQLRALRKGKRVIPLLVQGEIDRPLHLEHLQYRDFSTSERYPIALRELLSDLHNPSPIALPTQYLHTYVTTPPPPPTLIHRPEQIAALRAAVIGDDGTSEITLSALRGMGGVGKTVLAQLLCYDQVVQAAFPDGIIWINLGREPGDLLPKFREIGRAIADSMEHYDTPEGATNRLKTVLQGRAVLIVLDDVWTTTDVQPFRTDAPKCRMLITTRDATIGTVLGARTVSLDVLTREESISLLAKWASQGTTFRTDMAAEVAAECGDLPFSLAICGAMLRDGELWPDVLAALRARELPLLERQLPGVIYPNVMKCIQASLDMLSKSNPTVVSRYLDLAAFLPDKRIPEAAIEVVWRHTAKLTARETRSILITLERKSMIQQLQGEPPLRWVTLHDHQCDYLAYHSRQGPNLHTLLIQAYRETCRDQWHTGPNDGYFFQRLPMHMFAAGNLKELEALLCDARWLDAKLVACRDTSAITADCDLIYSTEYIPYLKHALSQASHILNRYPETLAQQLLLRLPAAAEHITHLKPAIDGYWLRPRVASLAIASSPEITFQTPRGSVITLAGSAALGLLAVLGSDSTISIFDLRTRRLQVVRLPVRTGHITCIAIGLSGKLVAGTDRGEILIWNNPLLDKTPVVIAGPPVAITSLALSTTANLLVTAASNTHLYVWSLTGGTANVAILKGHTHVVSCLALTYDSQLLVSGSHDRTIKLWNMSVNELASSIDVGFRVTSVALSQGDQQIISGADDGHLRLWNVHSRRLLRDIGRHTNSVTSIAVSPDNRFLCSGFHDRRIRIWDLANPSTPEYVLNYGSRISSLVFLHFDNTDFLTSGGSDGTVRLWTMNQAITAAEQANPQGRIVTIQKLSQHESIVARSSGKVSAWSSRNNRERNLAIVTSPIRALALDRERGVAFTYKRSTKAELWKAQSTAGRECVETEAPISSAVFLPRANKLVLACDDGSLSIWDCLTHRISTKRWITRRSLYCLAGLPDERYLLATSWDATVRLINISSGEIIDVADHPGAMRINSITVTADGSRFFTASDVSTVARWELPQLKPIDLWSCDAGSINALSSSDDGNTVAAACERNCLYVRLGRGLSSFATSYFDSPVVACCVEDSGGRVIAGDESGTIHSFDISQ